MKQLLKVKNFIFIPFTPAISLFICKLNMSSQTRIFWSCQQVLKVTLFLIIFGCVCWFMIFYFFPKTDRVCYPRVGCFDLSGPWLERPSLFNFFPQSPNSINTTFIISSRHQHEGQRETWTLYTPFRFPNLRNVRWGTGDLIVFIIHGYTDDSTTWMQDLQEAFLELGDITVILVDWRNGASGYYPQVVANTRVVAREISMIISQLLRQQSPQGIFPQAKKRFHLVGHSLGAQTASYVGKYFKRAPGTIHQITALDPAFPLFEGLPSEIRLHRDDAKHVLVLHSNIGPWGLGLKEAVGTADIYFNNGRDQRGCIKMSSIIKEPLQLQLKTINLDSISHLKELLACSHRRAYEVLTDILQSLKRSDRTIARFVAYPMLMTTANDVESASVKLSHCRGKDDGCWKLTDQIENYFFQFPPPDSFRIYGHATSFFMATTNRSPFCSRFAFLEILTCPSAFPSLIKPISMDYLITISYLAFGDEVDIYRGKIIGQERIQAWIEFSCESLGNADAPNNAKLNILFSVTYTKQGQGLKLAGNASDNGSTRKLDSFCWTEMQLTYYSNSAKELVILKPCQTVKGTREEGRQVQDQGGIIVTPPLSNLNHCFEVSFTF